eukprot:GSChrysophyteH1.ASY1.ANO1.916.1 assembled CDS
MASRREVRMRKEFLFQKAQSVGEAVRNEKKRAIKRALDSSTSRLGDSADDDRQAVDNEYAQIGSREPKEVKLIIPGSQVINRGNIRIDELVDACKKADFTDIVTLVETRGNPDGLTISHLPYGPTCYFTLSNCVLRHDIPECSHASQAHPHLILEGLTTKVGRRVRQVLQALYPVPRPESKRVITFANRSDFISFRHHMYTKDTKGKVVIKEAGPRFEMQPYELRLGTLDQDAAEKEWVLRPYQNTSRKRRAL